MTERDGLQVLGGGSVPLGVRPIVCAWSYSCESILSHRVVSTTKPWSTQGFRVMLMGAEGGKALLLKKTG